MRRLRPWALLLVLYMGADFLDPAVPGIFFFDHDKVFVDGVVELKPVVAPLAPHQPAPGSGSRAVEVERRPATGHPVAPAPSPTPARWSSARRVDASAPAPPSPDDH